jgi:threonine dehydrogenase-like Zn-dependent dehydrogenase
MRALTVIPGKANSAAVCDMPEPPITDGPILVRTLAVGLCGTDSDIVSGAYGAAPAGEERLILGHESLGIVESAPAAAGFDKGDLVVGIVRRPDPVPCIACAAGEWDMCRNDHYTERGIKQRHGYCSERFRIDPQFLVKIDRAIGNVGVLLEPASVVAKAWEQIDRIGSRSQWRPRNVLITGAGPVGLLAALIGVQKGLEVHVLDRVQSGPKPQLIADLGAQYHTGAIAKLGVSPEIVIECAGASSLIFDSADNLTPYGIICLVGFSSGDRKVKIDAALLDRELVLENDAIFGTVNANLRHYNLAADALRKADRAWLQRLITRREPLENWASALTLRSDDVKVVIDFTL